MLCSKDNALSKDFAENTQGFAPNSSIFPGLEFSKWNSRPGVFTINFYRIPGCSRLQYLPFYPFLFLILCLSLPFPSSFLPFPPLYLSVLVWPLLSSWVWWVHVLVVFCLLPTVNKVAVSNFPLVHTLLNRCTSQRHVVIYEYNSCLTQ